MKAAAIIFTVLAILAAVLPVFSPRFGIGVNEAFMVAAFGIPAIVCSNLARPTAQP
jgi:hypothetical protein